jgi:hypothetical protein
VRLPNRIWHRLSPVPLRDSSIGETQRLTHTRPAQFSAVGVIRTKPLSQDSLGSHHHSLSSMLYRCTTQALSWEISSSPPLRPYGHHSPSFHALGRLSRHEYSTESQSFAGRRSPSAKSPGPWYPQVSRLIWSSCHQLVSRRRIQHSFHALTHGQTE